MASSSQNIRVGKAAVFWDVAECPIPEGQDLVSVARNIRAALKKAGFDDATYIEAFGDEFISFDEFAKAKINFCPVSLDADKHQMMISEFMCWAVRNHAPAYILVIIEDDTKRREFIKTFNLLRRKQYYCMLAQRVDSPLLHNGTVRTTWLWDSLARGGDAIQQPEDSFFVPLLTPPSLSGA